MKTETKEDRLEAYKKLLELAIDDQIKSKKYELMLHGYCALCHKLGININDLSELIAHHPDSFHIYWFGIHPDNTERIELLKLVIKEVEEELKPKNI